MFCVSASRQSRQFEFFDSNGTSSRYSVRQFSDKTDNFDFIAQIFPKMELGLEIQKANVEQEPASLKYSVCQFSGEKDNFDFFGPSVPKNEFCGRNFKKLCLDLESVPPRCHVRQLRAISWFL